jgi:hypothetical protein
MLVRQETGVQPATCEGGIGILNIEKDYRRYFFPAGFKTIGPKMPEVGLRLEYDFCSNQGRIKLRNILREGKHIL